MDRDAIPGRLLSWWQQCLLQRAPQSDALSVTALFGALGLYAFTDLVQAASASSWQVTLGMTLLDVAVLMLFARVVLRVAGRGARYVQTLTALAGTGALLGVFGIPLVLQAARAQQSGEPTGTLVLGWLILLVWNITVEAHIYRHALSSRFAIGLMISGLHVVTIMLLMEFFFPRATI